MAVRIVLNFCSKMIMFLILVLGLEVSAQFNESEQVLQNENTSIVYDEVPVIFSMASDWSFEAPILVTENESYFIGIEELLRQFDIYYTKNNEKKIISGWIENEARTFEINQKNMKITFNGNIHDISEHSIISNELLFLSSSKLDEIFEIKTTFNMRNLVMKASSAYELPHFKEQRLAKIRANALRLSGMSFVSDTAVGRTYHPFKFGVMDWSVTSIQGKNSGLSNNLNLNLGSELLFGEASVYTAFSDKSDSLFHYDPHSIGYQWRWVNNSFAPIRQVNISKAGYNKKEGELIRGSITNASTIPLRSTGSYTFSDYTEPLWLVELYLNSVLIDMTTADAAGLFVFEVPVLIGQTNIKTIAYGPSGQEIINERPINAPYALMGVKTFQYDINAVAALKSPTISTAQSSFSYGVTRFLTLSGGVIYVPDTLKNSYTPYGEMSLYPLSRLFGSIGYKYNSHILGNLNISLPLRMSISLEYQQNSVKNNASKAINLWGGRAHIPYKIGVVNGLIRSGAKQTFFESDTITNIDVALSTAIKRFRTSSTVRGSLNSVEEKYNYNLSASYFTKKAISLFSSADYDISENKMVIVSGGARKRIGKGVFEGRYDHGFSGNTNLISLSYGWDFSFAKTGVFASISDNDFDITENVSGSILFNGKKDIDFKNTSSVGHGNVVLAPYLDVNYNQVFDSGDSLLTITLNKLRVEPLKRDSLKRLETKVSYFQHSLEIDDKTIPYGAWQLPMKKFDILVDPNQQKKVYVPIQSVGEVSGMIYMAKPLSKGRNTSGKSEYDVIDGQGSLSRSALELLEMYQDTLLKFYTRMDNPFETINADLEMKLTEPRRENTVESISGFVKRRSPVEEMKKTNLMYGLSRVRVEFVDVNGKVVGEALSEYDGYYSYIGLYPGEYTVRIVPEQLKRLGLESIPIVSEVIKIKYELEGDFVDKVDFAVKELPVKNTDSGN